MTSCLHRRQHLWLPVYIGDNICDFFTWETTFVTSCLHRRQHLWLPVYIGDNICDFLFTWETTIVTSCLQERQHLWLPVYMGVNTCDFLFTWETTFLTSSLHGRQQLWLPVCIVVNWSPKKKRDLPVKKQVISLTSKPLIIRGTQMFLRFPFRFQIPQNRRQFRLLPPANDKAAISVIWNILNKLNCVNCFSRPYLCLLISSLI